MGNAFQRQEHSLTHDEIRAIKAQTGFSSTQIQRLFRRFQNLDKDGKGYLTRNDLLQVSEIVLNPIGERIVEMFVQNNKRRNVNNNVVSSSSSNNSGSHNNNPTINVQSVEDGSSPKCQNDDDDVSSDSCCDQMEDRIHFQDFARTFATFRPISKNTPTYAVNSREAKIKYLFSMVDMQGEGQFTVDNLHDLLEQMMGAKVEEDQLHQIAERIVREADKDGDGTVTLAEFEEATRELDVEGRMSFISFS